MNCVSTGNGKNAGAGFVVGCGVGAVGVGFIVGCGVGAVGVGIGVGSIVGNGVRVAGTGVAATTIAVGGVGDARTGVSASAVAVGCGVGCCVGGSLQEKSADASAVHAISAYIAPPRICVNPRASPAIRFAFIYRIIPNQSAC